MPTWRENIFLRDLLLTLEKIPAFSYLVIRIYYFPVFTVGGSKFFSQTLWVFEPNFCKRTEDVAFAGNATNEKWLLDCSFLIFLQQIDQLLGDPTRCSLGDVV